MLHRMFIVIQGVTNSAPQLTTSHWHLPYHNYAGPGTDIEGNILRNKLPVNALDTAALIHDIEYLALPYELADINFRDNLNSILDPLVKLSFAIKDYFQYKPPQSIEKYNELKYIVTTQPQYSNLLKLYNMYFLADRPKPIIKTNDIPILIKQTNLKSQKILPRRIPRQASSLLSQPPQPATERPPEWKENDKRPPSFLKDDIRI